MFFIFLTRTFFFLFFSNISIHCRNYCVAMTEPAYSLNVTPVTLACAVSFAVYITTTCY